MNSSSVRSISEEALLWLQALLCERFGGKIILEKRDNWIIVSNEDEPGEIRFGPVLDVFYYKECFIELDCSWVDVKEFGIKTPFDEPLPLLGLNDAPKSLIKRLPNSIVVSYDLFGMLYWILSRVEELNPEYIDNYERFPATVSHAFKNNYLHRPVVDEWLLVLKELIKDLWPRYKFIDKKFLIRVSHDVDVPCFYYFKSWLGIIRFFISSIVKKRGFKCAFLAVFIKLKYNKKIPDKDPANTFDWIMDVSESLGITSAFYFICGRTNKSMDAEYDISHPAMVDLLNKIYQRNHEIGLHPSFECYKDKISLKEELQELKTILLKEEIKQGDIGSRMHYLRWSHPLTLNILNELGIKYDSTLGYANISGFRCGTCHEYQAFDPILQKRLSIRIRPLIVMDDSVTSEQYMGLGITDEAAEKILYLKWRCLLVDGVFTLLWHNSSLKSQEEKDFYLKILQG